MLLQATNSILSLTNVQPTDAGPYRVTVTDDIGSMRSQPAFLVVNIRPTIVQSPQAASVVQGEPVAFRMLLSGSPPFSVRWRRNNIALTNVIVNSFESVYEIPAVQLSQAGTYGALVGNAAAANVASANALLTVLADTDRDGLPDVYETQTPGLSPTVSGDAAMDFDGDEFSNLSEYRAGTNPNDPTSLLRIIEVVPHDLGLLLRFGAVASRTYAVDYRDALTDSTWSILTNLPLTAVDGVTEVLDNSPRSGERFYRVRTPQ